MHGPCKFVKLRNFTIWRWRLRLIQRCLDHWLLEFLSSGQRTGSPLWLCEDPRTPEPPCRNRSISHLSFGRYLARTSVSSGNAPIPLPFAQLSASESSLCLHPSECAREASSREPSTTTQTRHMSLSWRFMVKHSEIDIHAKILKPNLHLQEAVLQVSRISNLCSMKMADQKLTNCCWTDKEQRIRVFYSERGIDTYEVVSFCVESQDLTSVVWHLRRWHVSVGLDVWSTVAVSASSVLFLSIFASHQINGADVYI